MRPGDITADQCATALRQLLPPGRALVGSNTDALLNAIGTELANAYAALQEAMPESNPALTQNMLSEWLRVGKVPTRAELIELLTRSGTVNIHDMRERIKPNKAQQEVVAVRQSRPGQMLAGDYVGNTGAEIWWGGEIIKFRADESRAGDRIEESPAQDRAVEFARAHLRADVARIYKHGCTRIADIQPNGNNALAPTGEPIISTHVQAVGAWSKFNETPGQGIVTADYLVGKRASAILMAAEYMPDRSGNSDNNLLNFSPFILWQDRATGDIKFTNTSSPGNYVDTTMLTGLPTNERIRVALKIAHDGDTQLVGTAYIWRADGTRRIARHSVEVTHFNADVELGIGWSLNDTIANGVSGQPAITLGGATITRDSTDGALNFPAANAWIDWTASSALALGETRYLTAEITLDPAGISHLASPGFVVAHIGDDPGASYPGAGTSHYFFLYCTIHNNGFDFDIWERWNNGWYKRAGFEQHTLYHTASANSNIFNPRKILFGGSRVAVGANNFLRLQCAVEQDDGSFNTFASNYGANFDKFKKFIIGAKPNYRYRGEMHNIAVRKTDQTFDAETAAGETNPASTHGVGGIFFPARFVGGDYKGQMRGGKIYKWDPNTAPHDNSVWGLLDTLTKDWE